MTAIVFDLDGTLIDSAPDLHAAALNLLRAEGLPDITFDQTRSFIGNGVPKLVERVMQAVDLPADPARHADLVAGFLRFYNAEPAVRTTVYPGVHAALHRLAAQGVPMGLCTNKPEGPSRAILAALDLAEFMDVVIGGDTLAVKKPDPTPLRMAFDRLGAGTGLFVGDSEVDSATAQALGVPFALYEGGYRRSPVTEIPHTHLFADFADLVALSPA
ncbi:MAG: phosphoglycolate phosphatase [Rhodobacteraceae bacterium]|nr:phosphoglycolate phosphatase [Paracoccaceae bacterium]